MIVIVKGWDAEAPVASATVIVKEKFPAVVGTPVTEPVIGPSPRPGGNVPAAVHEYGATPPEIPKFNEYGAPTAPAGKGDVEVNPMPPGPGVPAAAWFTVTDCPATVITPLRAPPVFAAAV